ncbi:N-terminal phage integrase SAM-like domain-containing protein [Saccharothrix yanglingensis]
MGDHRRIDISCVRSVHIRCPNTGDRRVDGVVDGLGGRGVGSASGTFVDPALGQTTLGEWVPVWREAHDVRPSTAAKYESHLRNHVLPRFGDVALREISRMTVKGWVKQVRRSCPTHGARRGDRAVDAPGRGGR